MNDPEEVKKLVEDRNPFSEAVAARAELKAKHRQRSPGEYSFSQDGQVRPILKKPAKLESKGEGHKRINKTK
jgi:hypothetical protein